MFYIVFFPFQVPCAPRESADVGLSQLLDNTDLDFVFDEVDGPSPSLNLTDFLSESFKQELDATVIDVVTLDADEPSATSTQISQQAPTPVDMTCDDALEAHMANVTLPITVDLVVPPALEGRPIFIHSRDIYILQSYYKSIKLGVDLNDNCGASAQFISHEGSKIWQVNMTLDELRLLTNTDVAKTVKRLFYVDKETETVVSGLKFLAIKGKDGGKTTVRVSRVGGSGENVSLSQYAWDSLMGLAPTILGAINDIEDDKTFVGYYYGQTVENIAKALKQSGLCQTAYESLSYIEKRTKVWTALDECSRDLDVNSQKRLPKFRIGDIKDKIKVHYWERMMKDVFVLMLVA